MAALKRFLPIIAGCLAAHLALQGVAVAQEQGDAPVFHTRGVSQAHAEELRNSILQAAQRVNRASSVEERTRWQEELCKRLIQSEDYVNALQVAHAVFLSDGADPERRAAHHFLMARIYRMMMEAAPDPTAMEDSRQLALATAREVISRRYPAQWGISAAAEQLQRELTSRSAIVAAEFAASKRAQGGVDLRQAEAAKAQTAAMEATIFGRGGAANSQRRFTPAPVPYGRTAAPAQQDVAIFSGRNLSREELVQRLGQNNSNRQRQAAVPGGVVSAARQDGAFQPAASDNEEFPDFGASSGRLTAAPVLRQGSMPLRQEFPGSSPGVPWEDSPVSERRQPAVRASTVSDTGRRPSAVAAALQARGVDTPGAGQGYIPGGINRPISIRGNDDPAKRGGGSTPTTRSGGGQGIRFSWNDQQPGRPSSSSSNSATTRMTGNIRIDPATGRPIADNIRRQGQN